jgi:hypothetical protein
MVTELDVKRYIVESLVGFEDDPPASNYEDGYRAALRAVLLDIWGTEEERRLDAEGDLDWYLYLRT